MSEIEKMYENTGVKSTHYDACTLEDKYWNNGELANLYGTLDRYLSFECPHYGEGCYSTCEYAYDKDEYPPFTAEKQINLIVFLANREIRISPTYISSGYYLNNISKIKSSRNISTFENSLAQHINAIWQDLTEEEKQQVKGILE